MEKKQSSIEWLENQLKERYSLMNSEPLFEKAKAMHKEEIITTWHKGYDNLSPMIDEDNCGDKYYNETYRGNK
jgi:hypothetical protein